MEHKRFLQRAWWGVLVLLGLAFLVHFTLIQLSNMPLNPVSFRLNSLIFNYVHPWFAQNWKFFAPQPVDTSDSMLIRGRGSQAGGSSVETTPWIDVSDPLVTALKRNRLSSLQLVQLMLSNAVVGYVNTVSKSEKATYEKDGKRYLKSPLPNDIDPVDLKIMSRTGQAVIEGLYPDMEFKEIQVGVSIDKFPRFTKRNDPSAPHDVSFTPVKWIKATAVAPFCCISSQTKGMRQ